MLEAKEGVGYAESLGIAVLCALVTADLRFGVLQSRSLDWGQCLLCHLCLCLLVDVLSVTLECFYLL